MTEFLLDNHGRPIHICGYAAVYGALSVPLDEFDGQRELIKKGAFDFVLRNLRLPTSCVLHHMAANGTVGTIFDRTLRIWTDPHGLGFTCGPLAVNAKNAWAIRSIVSGGVRGCSWSGVPAEVATEMIEGESVRVIKKFQHLSHISPLAGGFYPAAGTFCSHEHQDNLPPHIKPLARRWQASRRGRAA